jgi:HEAT repeat protein
MTDDSPENLRKFLESDDPAMVRMGLSMAKGSGVPEELHLTLLGILLWDSEEGNREAAKDLVDGIGIKNIPESRGWLESLDNLDVDIRRAAVAALGKFGEVRVVELLIRALENDDDDDVAEENVRAAAAEALGRFGEPAVEPLIRALADENKYVCSSAAEALGMIGDARAFEPLIELLNGQRRTTVRGYVIWDDEWICRAVAYALGEIGDARAVEPLIEIMIGPEMIGHTARENAASALGAIGDTRAVWPLIEALGDGDCEVRAATAEALGEIGDAGAVEPLIKALGDEWWGVRVATAEALGEIGDARAVEPLIGMLSDDNKWVRKHAVEALGKIGGEVE